MVLSRQNCYNRQKLSNYHSKATTTKSCCCQGPDMPGHGSVEAKTLESAKVIVLSRQNAIGVGTPCQQQLYYYRYNNCSTTTTTTISLSGTARYHPASRHTSARATSPIPGGSYVWPAHDERQHPIPDFPPYDVRPPHMHGAPTTDDTSHGDTDTKQLTRRALIMCLQQLPEAGSGVMMLRQESNR